MSNISNLLNKINLDTITFLDLKNCNIDDAQLEELIARLKNNVSIERIDLSGNKITAQGLVKLADMLEVKINIIDINLENNNLFVEVDKEAIRSRANFHGSLIGGHIASTLGYLLSGPLGIAVSPLVNYYLSSSLNDSIYLKLIQSFEKVVEQNRKTIQRIRLCLMRNIGILAEKAKGYSKNFIDEKGRTALHIFVLLRQKALLMQRLNQGDDITIKDAEKRTPSQLAAHLQDMELCALFIYKGVNYNTFLTNVTSKFAEQIIELRDKIAIVNQRAKQPPAILLSLATSGNNSMYSRDFLKEAYKEMLAFPEIEPVLQIAALASLGLHQLAAKIVPAHINKPIDPMDDKTYKIKRQKLRIIIDHMQDNVDDLTLGEVKGAYGVYYNGQNRLYVAGNRGNKFLVRGTLIHEITHFVAQEVFQNNCRPYFAYDEVNELRFRAISQSLYNNRHSLHERLQSVFAHYEPYQWHIELIVRVPQLIAMTNDDAIVKAQCPHLLAYYKEVFLPACSIHLNKLKEQNCIFNQTTSQSPQFYANPFIDLLAPQSNALLANKTVIIRMGLFSGNKNDVKAKEVLEKTLQNRMRAGASLAAGDGFFDSAAQSLNSIKKTCYTAKDLRSRCHDYVLALDKNSREKNWIYQRFLANSKRLCASDEMEAKQDAELDYLNYMANIRHTAEEIKRGEGLNIKEAIWGEQDIDGRILQTVLGVDLHVIEIRENPDAEGEFIAGHQLNGKSVDEAAIDYTAHNTIHIAVYNNHFVPVLPLDIKLEPVSMQNEGINEGKEKLPSQSSSKVTFFSTTNNSLKDNELLQQQIFQLKNKISQNPNDLEARVELADNYYLIGELKSAIQQCKEIIKLDKANISAYHNMACYYHILENSEKAEIYFNRGLNLNPHAGLQCEFAQFLIMQERHEEAIPHLREAVSKNTTNRFLSYGQLEQAIVPEQLALEIKQRNTVKINGSLLAAWLLLKIYLILNDKQGVEETFVCLKTLVEKDNSGLAYTLLAYGYQDLNNTDDASQCFQKVLELEPNNEIAKQNLTQLDLSIKSHVAP